MTHNFRKLDVWTLGMELVRGVYEVTKKLPKEELYGLSDQLRRAACRCRRILLKDRDVDRRKILRNFYVLRRGHSLKWRRSCWWQKWYTKLM